MDNAAQPNFFIVGAPKAGTTSLYRYLQQHPQIYMSPVKEPCFFAAEMRAENFAPEYQLRVCEGIQNLRAQLDRKEFDGPPVGLVVSWEDYLKLFRKVQDQRAIGEASVCYLWSETAAQAIHARIPQAKIVMILRDPAERAFSQHLHNVADGRVRHSFGEHIDRCIRTKDRAFSTEYPFLEYGLYYEQVKRYLELFPVGQVRIHLYEDWRDPARLLKDLCGFLGVGDLELDTTRRELERRAPRSVTGAYLLKKAGIWEGAKGLVPGPLRSRLKAMAFKSGGELKLDPADRARLIEYYRDDVGKLAELVGRDLSAWLR